LVVLAVVEDVVQIGPQVLLYVIPTSSKFGDIMSQFRRPRVLDSWKLEVSDHFSKVEI
jgi:hypothetical protein